MFFASQMQTTCRQERPEDSKSESFHRWPAHRSKLSLLKTFQTFEWPSKSKVSAAKAGNAASICIWNAKGRLNNALAVRLAKALVVTSLDFNFNSSFNLYLYLCHHCRRCHRHQQQHYRHHQSPPQTGGSTRRLMFPEKRQVGVYV